MQINKSGETFIANGRIFTIGGIVWANNGSDYCGLFGRITEIRDGADKETDNEGPDIYCDFDIPEKDYMVRQIEDRFSKLYRMPKRIDEVPLDSVVMAPEMLEPVAETLPETNEKLFALTYYLDSDEENVAGALAISNDRATLVRKMLGDLDSRNVKAVLTHTQENEDSSEYLFEPINIAEDDFCIGYSIVALPVYSVAKGGAAA